MTDPAPIEFEAAVTAALAEPSPPPPPRKKVRKPVAYEIPRELEAQPAGIIRCGEPVDDYCPVEDLSHALGCNSGTLWRWIHQMGKIPYWKVEGTRAHHVHKADAEAWIAELDGLSKPERKKRLAITKEMRKARLEELGHSGSPPQAEIRQHPVAEQLGFEIPLRSEPPPPPPGAVIDPNQFYRPLPWIQATRGIPMIVLVAAIKAGELPANKWGPHYWVVQSDLIEWLQRTRYKP